jgi:hypothetical protein
VVAHFAITSGDQLEQVGKPSGSLADDEERRAVALRVKGLHDAIGQALDGAVIERERNSPTSWRCARANEWRRKHQRL